MKALKYSVFGLFIIFIAVFSALNAQSVVINYYFGNIYLPMALLLVIVFIFAIAISSLLFLMKVVNLRIKIRSLEKKCNTLEKQL
ncbi:lipopolysaccharide assembly protein LapA domain-containing protein [Piscirickettsia salmonis]|uniref:lipopolysaccharide assembly protein LapA domain-containing protein n=1 Tax=Piscirickettsia salmonis TaxID=1238 RepID=UPI0007C8E5A1|nr:hypothetical protein A0O36_00957 [Piscirickettsiaceae bacterium NZ-RLO1]